MSAEGRCPDQCGECCTYMTFELPSTDADYIQWLVWHGVGVVYRCGGFHARIPIACQHHQADGSCAIYEERLPMCREYDCEKAQDYSEHVAHFMREKLGRG